MMALVEQVRNAGGLAATRELVWGTVESGHQNPASSCAGRDRTGFSRGRKKSKRALESYRIQYILLL